MHCRYKYPIPNTKYGRGLVLFCGRANPKDPVAKEPGKYSKRRYRPPEQQIRNGEKRGSAGAEPVPAVLEPVHHVSEENGPDNRPRRGGIPRLSAKYLLFPGFLGHLLYSADNLNQPD